MNIVNSTFDYSIIPPSSNETSNIVQFHSARQIITRARMENKPLLIVEGRDDVSIYEKFSKKAKKEVRIRAIETINGYSEGCSNVIKFIKEAQEVINESEINKNYILGIIDKDASYYRGEINTHLECLFILEAYSYESHFVTQNHTRYLVENLVHSTQNINQKIIDYVECDLESYYTELYYLSLEALKNACCKEYSSELGFKWTYGQIKNNKTGLLEKVLSKKEDLDKFAVEKQITINDIKRVVKGKWLIEQYIDSVFLRIKELEMLCSNNNMNFINCIFCFSGSTNKCEWQTKKSASKEYARLLVYQHIDLSETNYIINRLQKLA